MKDPVIQTLGLSLALGLLVGLQRERSGSRVAGIRTFALVTVFGTVCGLMGLQFGGWVVVGGFAGVIAMLVLGNLTETRDGEPGQTTEAAALLMFGLGAYLVIGDRGACVAIGGVVALLLHLKRPLHRFVESMGEKDIAALMQFVVITMIVLPLLPDTTFGPYQVVNPREVWLMVVLIVGISLLGYVAFKLFGERAGTLLGGVLGGLISSTATTVAYARRTREEPGAVRLAAAVILVASVVSYTRVLIEIAIVAPAVFRVVLFPLGAMTLVLAALAAAVFGWRGPHRDQMPEPENPTELKSALIFGGLYALVIVGIAAAKTHFGEGGLYAVAVLSGLTDMDAITLSTSALMKEGKVEVGTGWRVILVASLANLAFKAGIASALGVRGLAGRIVILFGLAIGAGISLVIFWPDRM